MLISYANLPRWPGGEGNGNGQERGFGLGREVVGPSAMMTRLCS